MEPSLQSKGNKPCKVAFKINQNVSSWLGIGACYKNAVSGSTYNFNTSDMNHGGYIVICSGSNFDF
jgi:hypothetical protein